MAEPLSRVTVFVSPLSGSVSLASTPGAATVSVVSSSVVPVSATAVGGSLVAVIAMRLFTHWLAIALGLVAVAILEFVQRDAIV